ncbi:hypothetical protein [Herbaspirillum sp. RV1423]|uniref:hypothetical protein n=1 Tax=Herbaspirillum sp. RV1423 TaxID=1443993 RepID=UPI00055129B8|nr:hypothetical protein [Herbaspirillum sp. RV1423]
MKKWIVFYIEAGSTEELPMGVTAENKEEAEKRAIDAIEDMHFVEGVTTEFELTTMHQIANDADLYHAMWNPDAWIKCRGD